MTGAAKHASTPQFVFHKGDVLSWRNRDWTPERRRGNVIDFVHGVELETMTDEEIAGLIGMREARIVRVGASAKDRQYAAAGMDLAQLPSSVIADGRRKVAYVHELVQRRLTWHAPTAKVEEAISDVAAQICDPHTLGLTAFGPRSVTAKWQKLASAAGQPLDRLAHMRWHEREGNSNKDVVSLMGVGVRATQVRSEDLRFCPHCLAEANGPERRLHLQVWQLHLVTACPVHGNLLIDACDECGETFWHYRKTKPWACACGREMTGMKTVRAPRGAVETASAIMSHPSLRGSAGYFETDRSRLLPAEFRELSLDDLLAVLAKIGLLAMTPEADDAPVGPRAKVHRGVMLDADADEPAAGSSSHDFGMSGGLSSLSRSGHSPLA